MQELPRAVATALLAGGVVAAFALPGLTAAFGWRMANGWGVDLEPHDVTEQSIENGTRVTFVFHAFRAEAEQDVAFTGGSATLRVGDESFAVESVTATPACEPKACFRAVRFAFVVPPSLVPLPGWLLEARTFWESDPLDIEAPLEVSASGSGARFDA